MNEKLIWAGIVALLVATIGVLFWAGEGDECAAHGGHTEAKTSTVIVNGKVGVGVVSACLSDDGRTIQLD